MDRTDETTHTPLSSGDRPADGFSGTGTDTRQLNKSALSTLRVTLLGGDARQLAVARRLAQAGITVRAVGLSRCLPDGVIPCRDISEATADGVDAIVLPLPVTRDQETVWCPLDADCVVTTDCLTGLYAAGKLPRLRRIYGGNIPAAWCERLEAVLGAGSVLDFYRTESVQLRNARLTAEGAIMTMMEQTDTALLGSRAAVIGYGRIGQYLSRLLLALGVRVDVFARRCESRALAAGDGCGTADTETKLDTLTGGYDVIFNTVPARLITRGILEKLPPHTLIVDLASVPGGFDPAVAREEAQKRGLRTVSVPSIPGRYAPAAAGAVIADAILEAMGKGGMLT